VLVLLAAPAGALEVDEVGQLGGACRAAVVSGNRAYMGAGYHLVVLDVTTPSNPVVLGKSAALPGSVSGLAVSGNYAYVADSNFGLQIIDVSSASNPHKVGSYRRAHGLTAWRCPAAMPTSRKTAASR